MSSKATFDQHLAVIRDLARWFAREDVPYCVIGGVAASILGRARTTRDVDALILVDLEQWPELILSGRGFGFSPRRSDALEFARRSRVFLLSHDSTGIQVDVSVGALPFEHEIITRANKVAFGTVEFTVPTPEDFIVLKAVAGRPQDWIDIAAVLDAHPKLDLRRVRRYAKQFAEVLDAMEMTERLESLLASRRRRSRRSS